ncbi:MAG: hypothetical protein GX846_09795 [Deltaproteobacteria bacterium]|nr:hypothetical protein [Deltaproteobacteria bacterium]
MKEIELINDENMALWYDPVSKYVHHQIKKSLPKGAFEKLLSTGADHLEKYSMKKWLSDDSNVVAITKDDAEWGDKVWATRVIKAGFKYWAVVMPTSAMGSLQVNRFVREYREKGVTVEVFNSVDAARTWLDSK